MDRKLNKFQKAKIAVSTLYNMNYVCCSLNKVQWRQAKAMASHSLEEVDYQYILSLNVLQGRSQKDGKDWIAEFVKQSIEGEQITTKAT